MVLQQTLKNEIQLSGVGVHSGLPAHLTLKPAPLSHGIRFVRTDLPSAPPIEAHYKNVVCTQLATTLGNGQATVSTVEHLLAALHGLEVDNVLIEVSGPEVPILDGSSALFCQAIESTGLVHQLRPRSYLRLKKKVELKMGEKWAVAEPAARLEIFGSIEWDHPSIGYQEFHFIEGRTAFRDLAQARTFGFLREVEALKKMGLARGGSLENAVVLDQALVLNPEGLRCPDEFVRHKVLDALGDFKLAGVGLQAFVRLHRAGHDLHCQLLNEIFSDAANYEMVETTESVEQPKNRALSLVRSMLVPA